VTSAYRELARQPHVPALFVWGIAARLPLGMTPLALLLTARAEGYGYGTAGGLVGAYTAGLALGAPVAGRQLDRVGRRRVLRRRAIGYPLLLAVAAALLLLDAPVAVTAAAALVAGLSLPPVGSAVRSLWSTVVEGRLLQSAFSLEAALQEVYFTVGPLLVAALALADPAYALALAGVGTLVATFALTRLPPLAEVDTRTAHIPAESRRTRFGAIGAPGVRTLVVFSGCLGVGFGGLEVALPAFAEEHAHGATAGLLLAGLAGGSLAGGLLAGARPAVDLVARLRAAAACLVPAFAVLLLPPSIALMALGAFVAGLPIAPAFAASYGVVDRVATPGAVGESFAWISTAVVTGVSIGTAGGGSLIDAGGPDAALLLAIGAAAAAALVVVAGTRTLSHRSGVRA
jgi:predicted MFS family arabinose efflux permease